jgi:oxygen-independent coproporphyrinogen-3 oxidase
VIPELAGFEPAGPVALYIHVPFCARRCDYCNSFSCGVPDEHTVTQVLDATLLQLEGMLDRLGRPPVRTVYLGGGTPSVLSAQSTRRLGHGVLQAVDAAGLEEWTVEANPQTVTEEWLSVVAELPVTRISIGVQSFSAAARSSIGRRTTNGTIARALALARRGRWSLGVDLIAGIPGVGAEEQVRDVELALEAGVSHLSLYTLMVEESTPLARRVAAGGVTLPPDEDVVEAVDACRELLEAAGLQRYEVSSYAAPGHECRHNDAYWLLDPYIGVGPSAVSTLPGRDGTALRLRVPPVVGGLGEATGVTVERVSRRSFLLEHFMMGLRRRNGLSLRRIRSRFGAELDELAGRTVARWEAAGVLERTPHGIRVTGQGMWYLDALLAEVARELPSA